MKDQALRACLAQGFEPIKADQCLTFSSHEFIDEVKAVLQQMKTA